MEVVNLRKTQQMRCYPLQCAYVGAESAARLFLDPEILLLKLSSLGIPVEERRSPFFQLLSSPWPSL